MSNNINNKNTSNQMRVLMKRMRDGKYDVNESNDNEKKDLSMRDMLKITRNLNENIEEGRLANLGAGIGMTAGSIFGNPNAGQTAPMNKPGMEQSINVNRKNVYDQTQEEEKLRAYFNDMNVDIKFIDLKITNNLIFWGGTIDGVIQFAYKVTPDEKTSGIEFNYLPDFSADNPDNEMIIERIESYYDTFYKYWRNNILQ